MQAMLKKDHDVRWLAVGMLKVIWTSAQREQRQPDINKIADNFDPDLFGVLTVTEPNGKGIFHIIDGGHRALAVGQLWGDEQRVPCTVLLDKDEAGAAKVFKGINQGRRGIQPLEMFKVDVTARLTEAVEIKDVANAVGFEIGYEPGKIRAITSCRLVYRKHGIDGLRETLALIQDIWGREVDAVCSSIIGGVAVLLAKHGDKMDRRRMIDRSAKQYTPARLLGTAKSAREIHRGTMAANVALVLVENYNHNLREGSRLVAVGA